MRSKVSTAARIIVADDHPLFRSALVDTLRRCPNVEVTGEAAHGQEALELCRRLKPDLVLMDVRMPEMNGPEATRAIKRELPRTVVLMITASDEPGHLAEALEAGAAGYVLKTAHPQEIEDAIHRALDGESPLNQELAKELLVRLMKQAQTAHRPSDLAPEGSPFGEERPESSSALRTLSQRELDVLGLVAQGKTNQQISKELLVSVSTVKKHVRQVISKLGISDRTQAAVKALELGMHSKRNRGSDYQSP
jgi:DNA-binding NarL/FixJ family response regulator